MTWNAMNTPKYQSYFQCGSISDVGKQREENQDAILVDPETGLFIVSDGMGGHQGGALASKVVIKVLPKMIDAALKKLKKPHGRSIHSALRKSISELSQQLLAESSDKINLKGMGATLVMVLLQNNRAYIAHVGDSRAYLFHNNKLSQLTKDHSVVQVLLDAGEITPDEVKNHPARNQITRCIGIGEETYADTKSVAFKKGDRLLLCSDGLTNMVDDPGIARQLKQYADSQIACQKLVDAANAAGGNDNISIIILDWLGENKKKGQ